MQSSNKIPLGQIENIDKNTVGLGNVDNTSDVDKPISNATQSALNNKEDTINKATDFSTINDTLYPTVKAVNDQISGLSTLQLGETSTTAYRGDRGKEAYDHSQLTSGNPHNVTASQVGINNTDDVSEGSNNLYFTDTRVSNNPVVQANSSERHSHSNKTLLDSYNQTNADITGAINHAGLTTGNPHNVTASEVGLGNVDNTSDIDKPISTATQAALDDKADDSDLSAHISDQSNPHNVTKSQVGLSNVDNTSDLDKPISTATQGALNSKVESVTGTGVDNTDPINPVINIDKHTVGLGNVDNIKQIPFTDKGSNNGVAELDSNGKIPVSQLPSYVSDVETYPTLSSFPITGVDNLIYIAADTNLTYRWTGSTYAEISPSIALGETSSTAYRGDRGKIAYDHSQLTSGNPHNVTKSDVGLGNVDNTSDANKPISTATQTALNAKANTNIQIIAGDGLTGGGNLNANRTLNVQYGTTAGTAAEGNDSRLSDSREWIASVVSQAEAEAGTATTARKWTSQRVRQAILGWWNSVTSAWGRGFVNSTDAAAGRTALGLGNVDNTSDADKPISTATQNALNNKQDTLVSGVNIKTVGGQSLLGTGDIPIPPGLSLGETSSTAYRGDRGKIAYDHSQLTSGNPHNVNKGDVGLGNVDNMKQINADALGSTTQDPNNPSHPVILTEHNNSPGQGTHWYIQTMEHSSSGSKTQIARQYGFTGNDDVTYTRRYYNYNNANHWTPWKRLVTEDDIDRLPLILGRETIDDTPVWYQTNYPDSMVQEKKSVSTVGASSLIPSGSSLSVVTYIGTSSAYVYQVATSASSNKQIKRRGDITANAWGPWELLVGNPYKSIQGFFTWSEGFTETYNDTGGTITFSKSGSYQWYDFIISGAIFPNNKTAVLTSSHPHAQGDTTLVVVGGSRQSNTTVRVTAMAFLNMNGTTSTASAINVGTGFHPTPIFVEIRIYP